MAVVSVRADGVPEYDFRVEGTADWQWTDEELRGVVAAKPLAVHTGSLAAVLPPGADAVRRLLERSRTVATIAYDPNCRPLLMGSAAEVRPRIERMIELSDVVKVSLEDLAWLMPGRPPADVAVDWRARGPSLVVVTLGPEGALGVSRETTIVRRAGRPVTVADTVGAGDAFGSALLAALHDRRLLGADRRAQLRAMRPETVGEVLDEAVLASSITCTRRGADPPTRAEIRAARPA
jgi:fructokinase